jgi:hypothetical protein
MTDDPKSGGNVVALDAFRPPKKYTLHITVWPAGSCDYTFEGMEPDAEFDEAIRDAFARVAMAILEPADVYAVMSGVCLKRVGDHAEGVSAGRLEPEPSEDPLFACLFQSTMLFETLCGADDEAPE